MVQNRKIKHDYKNVLQIYRKEMNVTFSQQKGCKQWKPTYTMQYAGE